MPSRDSSTARSPEMRASPTSDAGTGQMCLYLASADRVVIGADLSRASLALGAAAAARFGLERVQFVETDLGRPGLERGAFDLVYSSGVVHHTRDPGASFGKLVELARPGGVIVLGGL
jgi:SAM-dependent methyltransferase